MQLAKITPNATMSSREMAVVTEKRHDSVKRTMESLRDKAIISFTQSVETSHDGAGSRPVEVYLVNKRDSYIVVAQLSPMHTARIVDRWQELEEKQTPVIRDPLLAAHIQALIELDYVKTEQQAQAKKLITLEKEIVLIGARTQPASEFFTVLGYANLVKQKIDYKTAAQFGRKCSIMSKQCGFLIGSVHDERHGSVNTYHVSILETIFEGAAK